MTIKTILPFKESFINRVVESFVEQNQELYSQEEITDEEMATQLTAWIHELKLQVRKRI